MSEKTPLTVENLMFAYFGGNIINGMYVIDVQTEIAPAKLPASGPDTIQCVQDGILITFKVKTVAHHTSLQG